MKTEKTATKMKFERWGQVWYSVTGQHHYEITRPMKDCYVLMIDNTQRYSGRLDSPAFLSLGLAKNAAQAHAQFATLTR